MLNKIPVFNCQIEIATLLCFDPWNHNEYTLKPWQLNREIAQHVYNKKPTSNEDGPVNASNSGDADSLHPLSIDTKKDLLYKIHIKNKYIKRLLGENETLKVEIDRQNEEILLLNVSLKQTAHKLTKSIADLLEQKNRNHMTADDMADLHTKINSVREQMTRIECDKQKYKHDVLYLGDEIQKKINQWNELLKQKYSSYQASEKTIDDGRANGVVVVVDEPYANEIDANATRHDDSRFEVNVLSQAITKRNLIITEMESLLIDLTMEISQSAVVINRIIKNLSKRETNFTSNLEKLKNHLAKLIERPNNFQYETQTVSDERANGQEKQEKSAKCRIKKIKQQPKIKWTSICSSCQPKMKLKSLISPKT